MTYETDLTAMFDLTTDNGKAAYQKYMTLENLEGAIQSLQDLLQDRANGDVDDEDFEPMLSGASDRVANALQIVRKYHS